MTRADGRPRAVAAALGRGFNQGIRPGILGGRIRNKSVVTHCAPGCTPAARRSAGSFHRG